MILKDLIKEDDIWLEKGIVCVGENKTKIYYLEDEF